jgi:hypothetical protein
MPLVLPGKYVLKARFLPTGNREKWKAMMLFSE